VVKPLETLRVGIAVASCILGIGAGVRAQDRGEPLRGDDFDRAPPVEEPAGAPVRHRDGSEGASATPEPQPNGRRRAPAAQGSEPSPQSSGAESRDAPYRERRSADLDEGGAHSHVRRRADFDGPDWDAETIPQPPENPSDIRGAFHFGLELSLVDFQSATLELDGPLVVGTSRTIATYGLSQSAGFGVLVGYGISDNFVFNTRVTLSNTSTSFGDADSIDELRFQLAPSLEYAFGSLTSRLRPFLAAAVGLLVGDTPSGPIDVREVSFLLGGQIGLHVFPDKHVSLDPTVLVSYRVGSASADAGRAIDETVDYNIQGIVVLFALGLSYWS
jgi:hypothetical protein